MIVLHYRAKNVKLAVVECDADDCESEVGKLIFYKKGVGSELRYVDKLAIGHGWKVGEGEWCPKHHDWEKSSK